MRTTPPKFRYRHYMAILALAVFVIALQPGPSRADEPAGLTMVVMDPLAAPLACDCVQGYAQRKYERLAEFLSQRIHRPVKVVFHEDLKQALAGDAAGQAHLVVGKDSVVRHDAPECGLTVAPLARLTGAKGETTLHGLFAVRTDDPAQSLADLAGYEVYFGPDESVEKHEAAVAALRSAGIPVGVARRVFPACSDAAVELVRQPAAVRAVAVVSSYAAPLLEGCGAIGPGELRVIGQTEPHPFITAFATSALDPALRDPLRDALLSVGNDPSLCQSLETLKGFVPIVEKD